MKRTFTLGQVLTITGEKLLCEVGDVYDILNFMTGDGLYTHQLPRARDECKPWVLRQHPQLEGIDSNAVTPETYRQWLSEQVELLGNAFELEPIPADDHERRNPIEELVEMVGPERVVVLERGDA
jgi:hypothetical protein